MAKDRLESVIEGGAPTIGQMAPDFDLPSLTGGVRRILRLSDFRGQKNVLLAFYPFNWQEASARQLTGYQAQRSRLLAAQAEAVAVTADSIMNITAWERQIGPFEFPLCSDFWPHGQVCSRYGVLRDSGSSAGSPERVVFVVNRDGRVVQRRAYTDDEVPVLEDVLTVLEKL